MHSKIICIYCICDDFLSAFGLKDDKQCRMTSAEVLTVAIISAIFFNGNLDSGCVQYLQSILRKRIETTFSQITNMFPRKIHAVTKQGFLLN